MELIRPSFQILSNIDGYDMLANIELAGRTCYKSENNITHNSAKEFVQMIINRGHESVLEHERITVKIICDRGVSHELVRHRIASYSQESTRYCNYYKKGMVFIIPFWSDLQPSEWTMEQVDHSSPISFTSADLIWLRAMASAEIYYNGLIYQSWKPEQARSVLPNSLKTEIVITANLREWRLIFRQRTAKTAHPQMREIMIPLLFEFRNRIPIVFDDPSI